MSFEPEVVIHDQENTDTNVTRTYYRVKYVQVCTIQYCE
jgi:hypothetical protein